MASLRARAPGRVNLIGDHTDYTGGLVLPMTIDRWTVVDGTAGGDRLHLTSSEASEPVVLHLPVGDPAAVEPAWGRYVAGVAAELGTTEGFTGQLTTTIPVGAGLSSSAALEVAVALALGGPEDPVELARLCQRAEHRASGVPSGIMDQLCIAAGVEGHALLIDCGDLEVRPVPLPASVEVLVRFVAHRTLVGSAYADRVAQCAAAEAVIGPLRDADLAAVDELDDPLLRARARHVVTENRRVREVVAALEVGDVVTAGRLLVEGHVSLRDDFGTSTAQMDAAVEELCRTPGVLGARMTGGGFGGCVVALIEPGAAVPGWRVRPVTGAQRAIEG